MTEPEIPAFTSFPKAHREALSKKKLVSSEEETIRNNSVILKVTYSTRRIKLNMEKKNIKKVLILAIFVQIIPLKIFPKATSEWRN